ncbi:MAG: amidohydrolase [Bacillota bacterium]
MDLKGEVAAHRDELIEIRRDLHRHPELGFEEHRTSAVVAEYLESVGADVEIVAGTGVVGLLGGGDEGPTLLLRADMDGLPLQEKSRVPYRSIYEGKMHACGHDGHTAMLLVAARILSEYRDRIRGNIKFVFQPNEEDAGAGHMIDEGVLLDPVVDAALGLHLWSPLETGKIAIGPGPVMAASHYFSLTVRGKGGHAGFPHQSVDPIAAAAEIVGSVQSIQTRETDPAHPLVIMFGRIEGGTSPTIIPERVEMEGSIRFLHPGGEAAEESFERVVRGICRAHGTTCDLRFRVGNRILVNDQAMAELVFGAARGVVGAENVTDEMRTMVGEDFSEFALRVPSAFYFVGSGNRDRGTDYPHHHPRFDIDEDSLPVGVQMHVAAALEFFRRFRRDG